MSGKGKVALLTGANRGLSLEIARGLFRQREPYPW